MSKIIPLTRGFSATIDDGDFEYLSQYKYHYDKGYAARTVRLDNGKQSLVYMHVDIMGKRDGMEIDHADLDGLNNQRENLRHCTHADNMKNRKMSKNNTSGYRGVQKVKGTDKWMAVIMIDGKSKYLGRFSNTEDAARAYDEAASSGSIYCRTNFSH